MSTFLCSRACTHASEVNVLVIQTISNSRIERLVLVTIKDHINFADHQFLEKIACFPEKEKVIARGIRYRKRMMMYDCQLIAVAVFITNDFIVALGKS